MTKRLICLALTLCLVLTMASAFAAGAGVSAGLLMRLATRTGPATKYDEQGTYFINNWETTKVTVLSKAWDNPNQIWWVQVEYQVSNTWLRSYTGLKRVNVDIDLIPEEQLYGKDTVAYAADALWGPGTKYYKAKYNVPANTSVSIYDWENGYVQVEFYDSRTSCYRRAWIPEGNLKIGGWSWIGDTNSAYGVITPGTYGLNGREYDSIWVTAATESKISFSLTFDGVAWIDGIEATYSSEAGAYRFAHNADGLGILYGYVEDINNGWLHVVIEYCTNSNFNYVLQQEGYNDSYYTYLYSHGPLRSYPDGN